jgi:hypothetical protein
MQSPLTSTSAPTSRKSITAKGFLISLGVGIATAGLGLIPLMGIPGALVYSLLYPIVSLFLGNTTIDGDAMWPIAIIMTLIWPISFPVGYLAAWGIFAHRKRRFKWFMLIAITLLWGLALTFYCVFTASKK